MSVKVFTAFNVAEASGPVVGLFRPDAIWTTGGGLRLTGRDEISAFTHQVLPRANRDSTATYEVVQVLFIRLDVAAVKVPDVAVFDLTRMESEDIGPLSLEFVKQAAAETAAVMQSRRLERR